MNRYEHILLDSAEVDLDEAFVWYELHKPGLGIAFILEVEKSFFRINQYPFASEKKFRNIFRMVM